jgi:hypothetical protein
VNFGYAGVIVVSLVLGAIVGYVGRSEDAALRCMLPLILYTVFVGGMFALLFSNGLVLLLLASRWIAARHTARRTGNGVNAAGGSPS